MYVMMGHTLAYTLDERATTLHDALHTKQTFLLPIEEKENQ